MLFLLCFLLLAFPQPAVLFVLKDTNTSPWLERAERKTLAAPGIKCSLVLPASARMQLGAVCGVLVLHYTVKTPQLKHLRICFRITISNFTKTTSKHLYCPSNANQKPNPLLPKVLAPICLRICPRKPTQICVFCLR